MRCLAPDLCRLARLPLFSDDVPATSCASASSCCQCDHARSGLLQISQLTIGDRWCDYRTFRSHAVRQALLEAAVSARVAMVLVHLTGLAEAARVLQVLPHTERDYGRRRFSFLPSALSCALVCTICILHVSCKGVLFSEEASKNVFSLSLDGCFLHASFSESPSLSRSPRGFNYGISLSRPLLQEGIRAVERAGRV